MQVLFYINAKWKWFAILHLLVYQTVAIPSTEHLLHGSQYRWAASEPYRQQPRETATGSLHSRRPSSDPAPKQGTGSSTSKSSPTFMNVTEDPDYTHLFLVAGYIFPDDAPFDELTRGNPWRHADERSPDRWDSQEMAKYNISIAQLGVGFNWDGTSESIQKRGSKGVSINKVSGWTKFKDWIMGIIEVPIEVPVEKTRWRTRTRTRTKVIYTERGQARVADAVSNFHRATGEGPLPVERIPHNPGNTHWQTTGERPFDAGYFADNEGSQESPIRSTQPDQQKVYEAQQEHEKSSYQHDKKIEMSEQKTLENKHEIQKSEHAEVQERTQAKTATGNAEKYEAKAAELDKQEPRPRTLIDKYLEDAKKERARDREANQRGDQAKQKTTELKQEGKLLDEASTNLKSSSEQLNNQGAGIGEAQKSLNAGNVNEANSKLEVAREHGQQASVSDERATSKINEAAVRKQDRVQQQRPNPESQPSTDQEKADKQKADKEKADREKTDRAKADKEKTDKERVDRERVDREKADREKADREKADKQKADKQKADKEKADREKTDNEKVGKDKPKPESPPDGPPATPGEVAEVERAVSRASQLESEITRMHQVIATDNANAEAAGPRIAELQWQTADLRAQHDRLQQEYRRAPDMEKMRISGEKRAVTARLEDTRLNIFHEQRVIENNKEYHGHHQDELTGYQNEQAKVKSKLDRMNPKAVKSVKDAHMTSATKLGGEIEAIEARMLQNLQRHNEVMDTIWRQIHPDGDQYRRAIGQGKTLTAAQAREWDAVQAREKAAKTELIDLFKKRQASRLERAGIRTALYKADPAAALNFDVEYYPKNAAKGFYPSAGESGILDLGIAEGIPLTVDNDGRLVRPKSPMMDHDGQGTRFNEMKVKQWERFKELHPEADVPEPKIGGLDGADEPDVLRHKQAVRARMKFGDLWNPDGHVLEAFKTKDAMYLRHPTGKVFSSPLEGSTASLQRVFRLVDAVPEGAVEIAAGARLITTGTRMTATVARALTAAGVVLIPIAEVAVALVTGIMVVMQAVSTVQQIADGHYGQAAIDLYIAVHEMVDPSFAAIMLLYHVTRFIVDYAQKKHREHKCHDALNEEYKTEYKKKCGWRPHHVPTRKKMWSVKAFECKYYTEKDYKKAHLLKQDGWDRLPQMPQFAASHPIQHGKKPCQE
ncbi:hypothetical protein B0A48_14109 [Cryoendolithus antarcticus]|uniref:Enterotoxin n=1 Tax=Cryoendolithus antarcticus TaxID=1507870 RepID=A0A1V8SL66_9PEZI|nr:hypothetical protein B0A48_14109 [Cryoendolithus antarcticus]